jgi:hypothetical protein
MNFFSLNKYIQACLMFFTLTFAQPSWADSDDEYWAKVEKLKQDKDLDGLGKYLKTATATQVTQWQFLCYTTMYLYGVRLIDAGDQTKIACETLMKAKPVSETIQQAVQDNFSTLRTLAEKSPKPLIPRGKIVVVSTSLKPFEISMAKFMDAVAKGDFTDLGIDESQITSILFTNQFGKSITIKYDKSKKLNDQLKENGLRFDKNPF